MGKKANLDITETVLELKKLLLKQKTLKTEKRIKSLIAIKTGKFETRQAISDYLGVHIRTLERWLNNYKFGGIRELLIDKPKNKSSKIITPEIHNGLSQRVNDAHNPFLGYWDAQNWVKEQYNVDVKYHRIREYLIQHFKTKLKTPRKSHYKKDEEAEKAFLKTPKYPKQH
jgi:transposase